jgi:glutathione synthase
MRIGFVVNQVATEKPEYTTTRLSLAAAHREHESWLMGVDDFAHERDGTVTARARTSSRKHHESLDTYLEDVRGESGTEEQIRVDDLDVLFMRNDPAEDAVDRPWAVTSGVLFGQLAVARGVLVVNDPAGLANATNKTYFQHFPDMVRPRTLISRDLEAITSFVEELGGIAVLKPLQGSGGGGVFFVSDDESPNLRQIVESLLRDGYVVAQEQLPAAAHGDVRLFAMNGEPLQHGGAYAAFRRVNDTADPRSNMHVGGRAEPVEVTGDMLTLAEMARPKLVADGMFLVGLDIVGDKLMEVNVFSPGGLGSAQRVSGVDFANVVIEALERKVGFRRESGDRISNIRLATL